MKLVACTIGKTELKCEIPYPYLCYTDGYIENDWNNLKGIRDKTLERVQYLASRRNGAVASLLSKYPSTTDVLMIDSYYVNQTGPIMDLISWYNVLTQKFGKCIVGGSTWVSTYYFPYRKVVFWDSWTTPEGRRLSLNDPTIMRVRAVGGVFVFPVDTWMRHPFGVDKFPYGCECNSLCENSGLPIFLNSHTQFYHPNPRRYSFVKTIRVYAGYYRRKLLA